MESIITLASFVAVSHPATYKLTSKLLGGWVATSDGLPKIGGLILHAVVFLFLVGFLILLLFPRASGFKLFGVQFGNKSKPERSRKNKMLAKY
jgi:hypothetical protein